MISATRPSSSPADTSRQYADSDRGTGRCRRRLRAMSMPESVYVPDGDGFVATELAAGTVGSERPARRRAVGAARPGDRAPRARSRRCTSPGSRSSCSARCRSAASRCGPARCGRARRCSSIEASLLADDIEVARAVGLRIREKPLDAARDDARRRAARIGRDARRTVRRSSASGR